MVAILSPDFRQHLFNFWLHDTPSLSGLVRILFYSLMLLVSLLSPLARPKLGDSPLQAPELLDNTDHELLSLEPLLSSLISKLGLSHASLILRLKTLRTLVVVSLVCCILGILGHTPAVVVGLGFFVLAAFSQSAIGVSHRWVLPAYSLLALTLADGNHELSLDKLLSDLVGPDLYPFSPKPLGEGGLILHSGVATKLTLMFGAYTLWAGGVSKCLNSGLKWCDGTSLSFYMRNTDAGGLPRLKKLLLSTPLALKLMAWASLIFELLSPMSLFIPSLRVPYLIACLKFHLGIWLTMNPNYLPQSLTYFLALPLSSLFSTIVPNSSQPNTLNNPHPPHWTEWLLVSSCLLVSLSLFVVAVFQIERWPFSCIPMYSFYRGRYGGDGRERDGGMDASSSDLATKGRKLQAKAKGKAAPRVGYFKRTSLTCLQQLDVLIEEARRTRYPYAIGWSGEWVKVYLYPQESNGRKEGGKGRREGEGEGGRVDVLALMKATEGVVAVHKASLRILFKAVMAHQLWTRDDPLVVKSHPKEGPSPGVDLLRKLSRVLKRAGVNVRGVMTLEVILEEGQTKVLAEIKD